MMSSNEKVKFRSIPNQENDRPLSTYDNLNNDTKMNGSNNASETECIDRCGENANEFPFTGISFRFDELKQLQPNSTAQSTPPILHTSNGYDNVTNNNYKLHRSTNGNGNNHNHYNQVTNDSVHFNGNGVNQMRNNQGHSNSNNNNSNHNNHHNTVTTIAQNHRSSSSAQSPSPTSSASSSSSTVSSSSTENNYQQSSVQYSNLGENNRSSNKPVHSLAKSQFLGLHKAAANGNDESQVDGNKVMKINGVTSKHSMADEVSAISDEEPLLNNYGNNRAMTANGSNRMPIATTSSNAQYQNIPTNSSCYGQNQIDNANECTCTCQSSDSTNEIKQYESDRYKCNGCLTTTTTTPATASSGNAPPINVIQSATMNVPSCSKMVDLSSCTTSMKPAKSTPLDTSSSFRMNQSSLSQAVYMSTTVPQNIKGCNIMGSHLPTRNSLRHSRMLVGKKTYQVVRRRNPLNIRHPNSVKYLFNFHILVGLGVSCLGLWLCWWAPSTTYHDNPYWSGLILMFSGILGLIVLAFKPRPRQKLRQHFIRFLRINSILITFIAALCTFVASSFAVFHLSNIMSPMADCRPVNIMEEASACTCRFDGVPRNETMFNGIPNDEIRRGGQYYRDVSCNEVRGFFKYILIASAILNFIGFLLCGTLLILLCMRQKPVKRVPYSSASSRHRL